ncbi:MAG: glycosyltransferase family 39 protein [Solirubrobacterales bacterium]|nr:glycosyltransferase family 39 protein [Solirubrobacterales bacterium]
MATVTAPRPGVGPTPPSTDEHPPRTPEWVRRVPPWLWAGGGLVALMALSAFMRSRYLGGQLWMDEAITTGIATHHLGQIPGVLRQDGNPPLYYMLLHVWISILGDSENATHALSLIFGVLTIPAAAWGAWQAFGRRAGVMAAILFAFNAWLTAYAQETRMYELMGLLGVLATTGFLLGFVLRRRRYLILFAVSLALMLYTHSWGTFTFAGMAIALIPALLASDDRRGLLRDAVASFVGAGILYLPWLPTLLYQVAHTAAPWDSPPRLGAPVQISRNLLGGDRITVILVLAALIGLGPLLTRRHRATRERALLATLLIIPLATLGLAWISSQVTPAWAPRYFAPVLGAILFLVAWGCARARVVGIVAIALSIVYLHNPGSFTPRYKSDMRDVAAEVTPWLAPGDLVVVGQPEQTPLNWYYLPGGLRFANTAQGIVSDPRYFDWIDALTRLQQAEPAPTLARLVDDLSSGQHLLFVRPLTEGAYNWKAPWTKLVRRRSAQWGQLLDRDVADGVLRPLTWAPHHYRGACCVADSAVLYEKVAR